MKIQILGHYSEENGQRIFIGVYRSYTPVDFELFLENKGLWKFTPSEGDITYIFKDKKPVGRCEGRPLIKFILSGEYIQKSEFVPTENPFSLK